METESGTGRKEPGTKRASPGTGRKIVCSSPRVSIPRTSPRDWSGTDPTRAPPTPSPPNPSPWKIRRRMATDRRKCSGCAFQARSRASRVAPRPSSGVYTAAATARRASWTPPTASRATPRGQRRRWTRFGSTAQPPPTDRDDARDRDSRSWAGAAARSGDARCTNSPTPRAPGTVTGTVTGTETGTGRSIATPRREVGFPGVDWR